MVSRLSALPLALFSVLLTILLTLQYQSTTVAAAHAFDAYRLIQYDRGSETFGSRRTALNHQAVIQTKAESATARDEAEWEGVEDEEDEIEIPKAATQDLARKVIVVRISQLSPAKLRSIVSRGATGILIVLPKDLSSIPAPDVARYKVLERFLATHSFDAAIYFAFEDEYLSEMVANMQFALDGGEIAPASKASSQDRYHVQVAQPDATLLTGVTVNNYYGYQHAAASSTTDSDTLPTIALVASYDSLGIVPGLGLGLEQNGSGTVALLEIARIFNRLYSDYRTQGAYNLLFILTSLDRFNYVATKNWLRNIDSRVLESLEFALCLERLSSSPNLYFHVSKMPKTPEIQSLYSRFEKTAKAMDIPFEIVHKKINISDPTVYWQHEQFSRKRIVAATLSSSKQPEINWDSASLFSQQAVDLKVLERNIRFVVESVSQQIYGLSKSPSPVTVLPADSGVNSHVLQGYLEFFKQNSRFTALFTEPKTNALLQTLEGYMQKFTSDFKKQTFNVDTILSATGAGGLGALKLYKDKEGGKEGKLGVVEMQVFQVKPFLFDVYLFIAILFYLLFVYIACQQPTSVGDVVEVLIGKRS